MSRGGVVLLVLLAACATTVDAPADPPRDVTPPGDPVVKSEPSPPALEPRPPLQPPPPVVTPTPAVTPEPPPPTETRPTSGLAHTYHDTAQRILAAARASPVGWERLTYLCDRIGHRLSGSKGLEQAVAWATETMRSDGLDEVRAEPVLVPVWVRGEERAVMTAPREQELDILGLGLSVGTPDGGIEADVLVCKDFDEFEARADEVAGKIVLFNHPMPPYDEERGSGYGSTVRYRTAGASRAGEKGALAVLVRSVTAKSLSTPHTGMLSYALGKPRIPAAAVTIEQADMIDRLAASGETVRVRLEMGAHSKPAAQSANVIGEIRGSTAPHEVVVFGGHLDSWDVGQGAHDDGGACVAVMEAMRILRTLGLRPRRTIRAVLFTNEENGLAGGTQYALQHRAELKDHVAALEMDSGTFHPLGLRSPKADDPAGERRRARLADLLGLFRDIGADRLTVGGGGADIGPMAPAGVPQIGLNVEGSRYFDYHHTHADTLDKIDPDDLALCAGVLAATVYVLADMPDRLGE